MLLKPFKSVLITSEFFIGLVLIVDGCLANNCEISCPSLITPVCGKHYNSGKQVFTNECLMRKYNCVKNTKYFRIPMSLCQRELREYQRNTMQISFMSNKKCKWSCILEYTPLCGCNQKGTKSFLNDCLMKLHNCEFDTSFRKLHSGYCFS